MAQVQAMASTTSALGGPSLRPCSRRTRATAVPSLRGAFLAQRLAAADLRTTSLSGESLGRAVAGAMGPPRVTMAKVSYICEDCGYIYKGRTAFEELGSDYRCPVCQAPKRRFGKWTATVANNANDTADRKARKEQLKKQDATVGSLLPILLGVILLGLVGAIVYLNSVY